MTQAKGPGGNRPVSGQGGQDGASGDFAGQAPPPPLASTAPPADLPELPHPPAMSKLARVAVGFGLLVLGGYAAVAMTGWQPAQPKRDELPASVRGSPGGYRSYHFWHSGYHGGK